MAIRSALLILSALLICISSPAAVAHAAKSLTAFQAREMAAKEVHADARNQVIEIYGRRDSKRALPTKWDIIFHDPSAQQHGRLVQISGDKIIGIKEGFVQIFRLAAYRQSEAMDWDDVKIDSPEVLNILQHVKTLSGIKISGLEMRLLKNRSDASAQWIVWLYGVGKKSGEFKKFGKAQLDAEDGRILELSFDPKKLR